MSQEAGRLQSIRSLPRCGAQAERCLEPFGFEPPLVSQRQAPLVRRGFVSRVFEAWPATRRAARTFRLCDALLRQQVAIHIDPCGADQDDEDSREDEQHQGKNQLHGRLRRLLFCGLPTLGTHRIALDA